MDMREVRQAQKEKETRIILCANLLQTLVLAGMVGAIGYWMYDSLVVGLIEQLDTILKLK